MKSVICEVCGHGQFIEEDDELVDRLVEAARAALPAAIAYGDMASEAPSCTGGADPLAGLELRDALEAYDR